MRRHRVHHLRRDQHRHRGPLGLVALEVGVEPVVDQIAQQLAELAHVLDAVRPLPLHGLPLLRGDVFPAREPGPVGFDQLDPFVRVGLAGLQTERGLDAHPCSLSGTTWAAPGRLCDPGLSCQSRRRTSGESTTAPDDFLQPSQLHGGHSACPAPRTTPPACTGSLTTPRCCRMPCSDTTPAESCGPTRCGCGSNGSTSTPRRTASSSASTPSRGESTATPSAPRCSTSWPPAARCRTPRPAP